jgi:hypothetical protein
MPARIKRCLLMLLWVVGSYFGSAMGLGFFLGVVFFFLAAANYDPTHHMTLIVLITQGIPVMVAVGALYLGLRGRLPGTKKSP